MLKYDRFLSAIARSISKLKAVGLLEANFQVLILVNIIFVGLFKIMLTRKHGGRALAHWLYGQQCGLRFLCAKRQTKQRVKSGIFRSG